MKKPEIPPKKMKKPEIPPKKMKKTAFSSVQEKNEKNTFSLFLPLNAYKNFRLIKKNEKDLL